jgi:hypothetical protein
VGYQEPEVGAARVAALQLSELRPPGVGHTSTEEFCDDWVVGADELPDRPGWYPDPYAAGSVRWFDGSMWTTHAVRSSEQHPDQVVQSHHDDTSPDERRTQEWRQQFPWWDTAVQQGSEPTFTGGGGARGFGLNQAARFDTRLGSRMRAYPIRAAGWFLVLAVLLFVMAGFDAQHRIILVVLGGIALLTSLTLRARALRSQERWRRVGKAD